MSLWPVGSPDRYRLHTHDVLELQRTSPTTLLSSLLITAGTHRSSCDLPHEGTQDLNRRDDTYQDRQLKFYIISIGRAIYDQIQFTALRRDNVFNFYASVNLLPFISPLRNPKALNLCSGWTRRTMLVWHCRPTPAQLRLRVVS